MYILLEDKAASIHTLGDLSEAIELGIRSDEPGPLTLRWSNIDTWNSSYDLFLEDRLTGDIVNLGKVSEYTFDNEAGNVQGRLFLKVIPLKDIVDKENLLPSDSDIRIYVSDKQIITNSCVNDPIESVKIYSLEGELLYEKQKIGQSLFSINLPIQKQMVIVTVITEHYQKKEKITIQ